MEDHKRVSHCNRIAFLVSFVLDFYVCGWWCSSLLPMMEERKKTGIFLGLSMEGDMNVVVVRLFLVSSRRSVANAMAWRF